MIPDAIIHAEADEPTKQKVGIQPFLDTDLCCDGKHSNETVVPSIEALS